MPSFVGAIRVVDVGMVELVSDTGDAVRPSDSLRAALVAAPVVGDLVVMKAERVHISTNRRVYRTRKRPHR